jgi:hypothetical protein
MDPEAGSQAIVPGGSDGLRSLVATMLLYSLLSELGGQACTSNSRQLQERVRRGLFGLWKLEASPHPTLCRDRSRGELGLVSLFEGYSQLTLAAAGLDA